MCRSRGLCPHWWVWVWVPVFATLAGAPSVVCHTLPDTRYSRGRHHTMKGLRMAEKRVEVVTITDDLDGHELDRDDHQRVRFTFDGKHRIIDLSTDHLGEFRADMERWMTASRPDHRNRKTPTSTGTRDTATIREWARANGFDVSDRGRIPAHVIDAYESA